MNRRDSFEIYWAEQNDVPVETMAQYRCDDDRQYRLPKMASRYRVWRAALDSVEIELPERATPEQAWCIEAQREENARASSRNQTLVLVRRAIEAAGLKVSN